MDEQSEVTSSTSIAEVYCDVIRGIQVQLHYLLVIGIVFVGLSLFSLLFIERGTASYLILQLDFLILGALIATVASSLYVCTRG